MGNLIINNMEDKELNKKNKKEDLPFITRNQKIITVILLVILAIILTVYLCLEYICTPYNVVGCSMNPTIYEGQKVYISKIHRDPVVGDIIAFISPRTASAPRKQVIKRVIAVEGDVILFNERKLIVNYSDKTSKEFYISYDQFALLKNLLPKTTAIAGEHYHTLREYQYFAIGDNYTNSFDCRNYGPIYKSDIMGIMVGLK